MAEKDLSARLDELLLGALTDGLELRETLEGLFSLTGMATVILDTGGLETMSVPAAGEGQEALRSALRALLERRDERARDLFRGRAAAFLPGEAGDGPALCRENPVVGGAVFADSKITVPDAPGLGIERVEGLIPLNI